MEETETTQADIPLPTEVAEALATSEQDAAAPEPSAEEEPKPAPWASAKDEYELEEHPELKSFFERRDRRIEEKLRDEYAEQTRVATDNWNATELARELSGRVGDILERLRDAEGLDDKAVTGIERVLDRLQGLVEPYKKPFQEAIVAHAADALDKYLAKVLREDLPRREQDELEDFARTRKGYREWVNLARKYAEFKAKAAENKAYDRGLKEGREAALEDARAKSRDGKGPDTTERRPTGSKPYSQMTREERMALSPAERDARAAQELKELGGQ